MTKTQGNFRIRVVEGEFTDSQIIVMLGENGTGKTTFIRMLVFFFLFITFLFFVMFSCLSYFGISCFLRGCVILLANSAGWFTET